MLDYYTDVFYNTDILNKWRAEYTMKAWKVVLIIVVLFCLAGSAFADYPKYCGQYGSAKYIGGRTLIVEIYANDAHTTWDTMERAEFQEAIAENKSKLTIGLRWLEEQVARYGQTAEFIIDPRNVQTEHFTAFSGDFETDLTSYSADGVRELTRFIDENVDVEDLMDYFDADNIVFAVYLNAPSGDDYRSYSVSSNYVDISENQYYYEMAVFTPYGHGRRNTPAVYAHEILHTFGALDLYHSCAYVPQTYVDYLTNNQKWELMNHCYFSEYDRVTTPFTDVDAYFVGLISTCEDVEKFGLGPSIYD